MESQQRTSLPIISTSVLIIGGGITGALIANKLAEKNIATCIVDKGRNIGGRAATKFVPTEISLENVSMNNTSMEDVKQEHAYEFGVPFFKGGHPLFLKFIDRLKHQFEPSTPQKNLPISTTVLGKTAEEIEVLDDQEKITQRKWYCALGNRSIPQFLIESIAGKTDESGKKLSQVFTSMKIAHLRKEEEGWIAETETNGDEQPQQFAAQYVVLTPPVPQTLALLQESNIPLQEELERRLEAVTYRKSCVLMAELQQSFQESNSEKNSTNMALRESGFLEFRDNISDESTDNVGRVMDYVVDSSARGIGNTATAAFFASESFSEKYFERDKIAIQEQMVHNAEQIGADVQNAFLHKWRYSQPKTFFNEPLAFADTERTLLLAGDGFLQSDGVEGAVRSGLHAATLLIEKFTVYEDVNLDFDS